MDGLVEVDMEIVVLELEDTMEETVSAVLVLAEVREVLDKKLLFPPYRE